MIASKSLGDERGGAGEGGVEGVERARMSKVGWKLNGFFKGKFTKKLTICVLLVRSGVSEMTPCPVKASYFHKCIFFNRKG